MNISNRTFPIHPLCMDNKDKQFVKLTDECIDSLPIEDLRRLLKWFRDNETLRFITFQEIKKDMAIKVESFKSELDHMNHMLSLIKYSTWQDYVNELQKK